VSTQTVSDKILQAFADRLLQVTGIGGRVFDDHHSAIDAEQKLPCLLVRLVKSPEPKVRNPFCDWELLVLVEVCASGAKPTRSADPILAQVYRLVMADRRLGGLAANINPGPTGWEGEPGQVGRIAIGFVVEFRTSLTDLTVQMP
jgi:hypothetical protein